MIALAGALEIHLVVPGKFTLIDMGKSNHFFTNSYIVDCVFDYDD